MNDALVALADNDAAAVRARHGVGHPPSLPLHDGILAELQGLRAKKRELDEERDPVAASAATLEREASAARERASTIAARLESSTGAGRELEAMTHERDALTSRASDVEDQLLELLDQLEGFDARDELLRTSAEDASRRRDRAAKDVGDERARASAVLEELSAARPALAAAVDPGLLVRYDAIAARAGGVGAARLVDGRCGACRVAAPTGVVDRLLHGGDEDAVAICDECGRLLVR